MTQTNKKTKATRMMYRKPTIRKSSSKLNYEWRVLTDQREWIVFGTGFNRLIGDTTSDDIESYFCNNRTKQHMNVKILGKQYKLNFDSMSQVNIESNTPRPIIRLEKIPIHSYRGLTTIYPINWDSHLADYLVKLVPIKNFEQEHQEVLNFIHKSDPNFTFASLERIQNPEVWKAYKTRQKHLKRMNPNINYCEMRLFHGTDGALRKDITEQNFDPRRYGDSTGCLYGQGIYFANR